MPLPAIPALAMSAVRIGAATAIAWKGMEEMKALGQTAADYLTTHKTGIDPGSGHNDAGDAFRHAFASAVVTQKYGETTANVLGSLHEYHGNFGGQPQKECGMDMWNNQVGREIGKSLPPGATEEQIGKAVVDALKRGDLVTSLADNRTDQGYKMLLSLDDLGNKATTMVKEAKAMVADITPGVIKEALANKNLSEPVMAGLSKGFAEVEKSFSTGFTAMLNRETPDRLASR